MQRKILVQRNLQETDDIVIYYQCSFDLCLNEHEPSATKRFLARSIEMNFLRYVLKYLFFFDSSYTEHLVEIGMIIVTKSIISRFGERNEDQVFGKIINN